VPRGGFGLVGWLVKKCGERGAQLRQLHDRRIPYQRVVHDRATVNEDVPE
jgi:hypothetical protein